MIYVQIADSLCGSNDAQCHCQSQSGHTADIFMIDKKKIFLGTNEADFSEKKVAGKVAANRR